MGYGEGPHRSQDSVCNLVWVVSSDDKALCFGALIVYVYVELCVGFKCCMFLCVCGVDMYLFDYLICD